MKKKIVCVIPARLESTRFPRKVLAKLGEKYMLEMVWEAAMSCPQFSHVYFAIDSELTAKVIDSFGGAHVMTAKECPTGTHRIIHFMNQGIVEADVWVNWQADEPFIKPQMIADLLQGVEKEGAIWTLKKEATLDEVLNKDVTKVVTDRFNRALYFSRSPIPFDRDRTSPTIYKHIGLYAYAEKVLQEIPALEQTPLAYAEKLEQLQFLELGMPIYVYNTTYETLGIDTPEDLIRANRLFNPIGYLFSSTKQLSDG